MPFEEDDQDPSIWFLDHSYLEVMYKMFKKVNGELPGPACCMHYHDPQMAEPT